MSAPKDWRAAWRSNFAPEFHALADQLMDAGEPFPAIFDAVEQAKAACSAWPSEFPAAHASLVRGLAAQGMTLLQVAAAVAQAERESHRRKQSDALAKARHRAALDSLRAKQEAAATGAEPGDFVAQARERAATAGITVSQAMARIARENPAAHRAWVNAQKHPRLLSRPPIKQEKAK